MKSVPNACSANQSVQMANRVSAPVPTSLAFEYWPRFCIESMRPHLIFLQRMQPTFIQLHGATAFTARQLGGAKAGQVEQSEFRMTYGHPCARLRKFTSRVSLVSSAILFIQLLKPVYRLSSTPFIAAWSDIECLRTDFSTPRKTRIHLFFEDQPLLSIYACIGRRQVPRQVGQCLRNRALKAARFRACSEVQNERVFLPCAAAVQLRDKVCRSRCSPVSSLSYIHGVRKGWPAGLVISVTEAPGIRAENFRSSS